MRLAQILQPQLRPHVTHIGSKSKSRRIELNKGTLSVDIPDCRPTEKRESLELLRLRVYILTY